MDRCTSSSSAAAGSAPASPERSRPRATRSPSSIATASRSDVCRPISRAFVVEGSGFDRDALTEARIEEADAFAAVTSGDNSNILAARIARETFGVERVVARIYDPQRAQVYQRLGIPTVATVTWTVDQVRQLAAARGVHAAVARRHRARCCSSTACSPSTSQARSCPRSKSAAKIRLDRGDARRRSAPRHHRARRSGRRPAPHRRAQGRAARARGSCSLRDAGHARRCPREGRGRGRRKRRHGGRRRPQAARPRRHDPRGRSRAGRALSAARRRALDRRRRLRGVVAPGRGHGRGRRDGRGHRRR